MGVILDGPLKDAVVSRESDLVLSIVEGQEPVSFVQGVLACRAARQCVAADGVEHDIDSTAPRLSHDGVDILQKKRVSIILKRQLLLQANMMIRTALLAWVMLAP